MRVLIATDRIGSMSSARAGALLSQGWPGADVTVLPIGEAGAGFAEAAADQLGLQLVPGVLGDRMVTLAVGAEATIVQVDASPNEETSGDWWAGSSFDLGQAVLQALERAPHPHRLILDLTAGPVHDAGAGFLCALGAGADAPLDQGAPPLSQLSRVNLGPVQDLLSGIDLIGVAGSTDLSAALLGLRGITSMRAREPGEDRERLLATDAALATFARLAAPDTVERAGAGACGGVGFAILALGGRLVSGPQFAFESAAPLAAAGMDVMVTGCSVFDFATRGGGVVAEVAEMATEQLCPCLVVAGDVLIGGREMRTMGVETAYAIRESTLDLPSRRDVSEEELSALARRIGRSWRW
jgi:glycerate kinase